MCLRLSTLQRDFANKKYLFVSCRLLFTIVMPVIAMQNIICNMLVAVLMSMLMCIIQGYKRDLEIFKTKTFAFQSETKPRSSNIFSRQDRDLTRPRPRHF